MSINYPTIGIIGGGVVGQATARTYLEYTDVRVYDSVKERRTTDDLDSVFESGIVFLCLPEASLEVFVDAIPTVHRSANLALKSTVPIGTTRWLSEKYGLTSIVHSPEFLTARCAVTDAQLPSRNIVGIPCRERTGLTDGAEMLWNLMVTRFPGVPVYRMTSDESEAVKLFQNSFFAVKVAYWNEVRCLADKLGLDWETVRNAILADGRICASHTQVPGPDGKRGFGGVCLPKDLNQLIRHLNDAMVPDAMTYGASRRNAYDRREGLE